MKLTGISPKILAPGLMGHYVHGEQLTLGLVDIVAGSTLSLHHHIHEQITYIIEGELQMIIGGKHVVLSTGMAYVIPSNVPHGAYAATHCKIIDVFNPPREDYK